MFTRAGIWVFFYNPLGNLADQSPMILMSVRDDDAKERLVRGAEARNVRQGNHVVSPCAEWPADIQHDASAGCFDLDAIPADLFGAAVYPDFHPCHTGRARRYRLLGLSIRRDLLEMCVAHVRCVAHGPNVPFGKGWYSLLDAIDDRLAKVA